MNTTKAIKTLTSANETVADILMGKYDYEDYWTYVYDVSDDLSVVTDFVASQEYSDEEYPSELSSATNYLNRIIHQTSDDQVEDFTMVQLAINDSINDLQKIK